MSSPEFTGQDLQITFKHVKAITVDPSFTSGDSRITHAIYRVGQEPVITTDLTGDIYATTGSNKNFYISGTCTPAATVKWYKDGNLFTGSSNSSISTIYTPSNSATKLSTDDGVYSTLTFSNASSSNIGAYNCVLINNFGTTASATKNLYIGYDNTYSGITFSPISNSEIRFGSYSGIVLTPQVAYGGYEIYYTTGSSDSLVDPSVTPNSNLTAYTANSPTIKYTNGSSIYFPADIETGYIKALVCYPNTPVNGVYRFFPGSVKSGIYTKRTAAASTYNIPSGAIIADNGFLFAVSSTNETDAETYIRITGSGLLGDLSDPLTNSTYSWTNGYGELPQRIRSYSAIKTIVSGTGLKPLSQGFSFESGVLQNKNYFNPQSGFYYDYIDINIPVIDLNVYNENTYSNPSVDLRYTTGEVDSIFDAPTTGSGLVVDLSYDGSNSFTGRLDISGDFDIKSLVVESGSQFGVTWTGEVAATFENKIKVSSFDFIDISSSPTATGNFFSGNLSTLSANGYSINKLSIGDQHALFTDINKNLYAIGYNTYGQLGTGSSVSYTSTPILIDTGVIGVSCGSHTSAYIKESGSSNILFTMGHNNQGQIGLGYYGIYNTLSHYLDKTKPVRYDNGVLVTGIEKVDAFAYSIGFKLTNNTLYIMGNIGQLYYYNTYSPTYISNNVTDFTVTYSPYNSQFQTCFYLVGSEFREFIPVSTSRTINVSGYKKITSSNDGYYVYLIDNSDKLWQYYLPNTQFTYLTSGVTDIDNQYYKKSGNLYRTNNQLVVSGVGEFNNTTTTLFYTKETASSYSYNIDSNDNPATLIYLPSGDGQPLSGSKSVAVSLEQLGGNRDLSSFLTYTLDGSDPTDASNKAYLLNTTTGETTGTTNIFFIPDSGLNIFATGTDDPIQIKVKAFVTGDSIGNINDSEIVTGEFYRKTLSPIFQTINYYSGIKDSAQTVLSNTGDFSGKFAKDSTIVVNFQNYIANQSTGKLDFYVNGNLISSTGNASTGVFYLASGDNTNTGEIVFSGYSSGYNPVTGTISGYFERWQLYTPSGSASGAYEIGGLVYPIYLYNNANNPNAKIKYTDNGTDPTDTNGTLINAGSQIGVNLGTTTVKWIATTGGYLNSEIASGVWEISNP